MTENNAFNELLGRLKAGDNGAWTAVISSCKHGLLAMIRSRLHQRIRDSAGTDAVFQSALASFYRRLKAGELSIENSRRLRRLVEGFVFKKCLEYARRGRVNLRTFSFDRDEAAPSWALEGLDVPPDKQAEINDLVEKLMSGLDPAQVEAVRMAIAENSVAEIARATGLSRYLVTETLERVGQRLQRVIPPMPTSPKDRSAGRS